MSVQWFGGTSGGAVRLTSGNSGAGYPDTLDAKTPGFAKVVPESYILKDVPTFISDIMSLSPYKVPASSDGSIVDIPSYDELKDILRLDNIKRPLTLMIKNATDSGNPIVASFCQEYDDLWGTVEAAFRLTILPKDIALYIRRYAVVSGFTHILQTMKGEKTSGWYCIPDSQYTTPVDFPSTIDGTATSGTVTATNSLTISKYNGKYIVNKIPSIGFQQHQKMVYTKGDFTYPYTMTDPITTGASNVIVGGSKFSGWLSEINFSDGKLTFYDKTGKARYRTAGEEVTDG